MLLIATDEAGYGPKLGPMVVAASVWSVPKTVDSWEADFAPYRQRTAAGDVWVVVDDSKAIFKSGSSLRPLRILAAHSAKHAQETAHCLDDFLKFIAPSDWRAIRKTPWLCGPSASDQKQAWPAAQEVSDLDKAWKQSPSQVCDVAARILTANQFNRFIGTGRNKADLLGECTLGLVRETLQRSTSRGPGDDGSRGASDDGSKTGGSKTGGPKTGGPETSNDVAVFCDRHGGRRYYAGLLQNHFPDTTPVIEIESKTVSRYRIRFEGREVTISFTVKGDRFTPVAYSSMIAKGIREEMMTRLNGYFANLAGDRVIRPTAGYPVDADRFLEATKSLRRKHKILDEDFIRCR